MLLIYHKQLKCSRKYSDVRARSVCVNTDALNGAKRANNNNEYNEKVREDVRSVFVVHRYSSSSLFYYVLLFCSCFSFFFASVLRVRIKKCFLSFLLYNNCNKVKSLSKLLNPCLRLLFLFLAHLYFAFARLFEKIFFFLFDNNFSSAALNAVWSTRWISAYSLHDPAVIIDCRCNDADVVISHDFFPLLFLAIVRDWSDFPINILYYCRFFQP